VIARSLGYRSRGIADAELTRRFWNPPSGPAQVPGIGVKGHMDKSITAAVALALATVTSAQTPVPPGLRFEVASVKINRSGAPFRMGRCFSQLDASK
jgi:hypothetical protein